MLRMVVNCTKGGGLDRQKAGANAGQSLETFSALTDALAYHGELIPLTEAVRLARPNYGDSEEVLEWAAE